MYDNFEIRYSVDSLERSRLICIVDEKIDCVVPNNLDIGEIPCQQIWS